MKIKKAFHLMQGVGEAAIVGEAPIDLIRACD